MHGGSPASISSDGRSIVTFSWGFVRRKKVGPLIRAADAAMSARHWPVAADLYAQVLEVQPALWHLRVQRGHALKELGQFDAAIAEYRAAAEADPGAADPWLHLGHLNHLRGDQEAATEDYRRALLADPNCDALRHLPSAAATGATHAIQRFSDTGRRPIVFWDVGYGGAPSQAAMRFDEESGWFEELGRQAQSVPVRFDPARGSFVSADAANEPIDSPPDERSDASSIYVTSLLANRDPIDTARALSAAQLSLKAAIVGVLRTSTAETSQSALLVRSSSSLLLASRDVAAQLRADAWRHRRTNGAADPVLGVGRPVRSYHPESMSRPTPAAGAKPGKLLFGWPADAAARDALRDRLTRLSPHFERCIAFAAEASFEADLAASGELPPTASTVIGRREAWLALEAPDTAGLLLPPGIESSDLWAIRAADAGVGVFTDGTDDRVLTAIGGTAVVDERFDEDVVGHRLRVGLAQAMFPPITFEAWLKGLADVVDHAALSLQPTPIRASVRFGLLYGFRPGPCPATSDAAFLLAGSWRLRDGACPVGGPDARIRILVAAHQQITCQLLVGPSEPVPGADGLPQWQQVTACVGPARADGFALVDFALPADHLDERFGNDCWEIRGMVFYPTEHDRHWFEFLDRASRGVECM